MRRRTFKSVFFFIGFLVCAGFFNLFACSGSSDTATPTFATDSLQIQTTSTLLSLTVEVADTAASQEYGLMNRASLDSNSGMLFVFDTEGIHSFWMRDTLISLDMIFADSQKHVVYIYENATPLSEEPIVPTEDCQYVVEVNAGYVAANGVNIGDTLIF